MAADTALKVLEDIKKQGADMFTALNQKEVNEDIYALKAVGMAQIIENLTIVVPDFLYTPYSEFFEVFCDFCVQCGNKEFLLQNKETMVSSLELFAECMEELIHNYQLKIRKCVCCNKQVIFDLSVDQNCLECGAGAMERMAAAFFQKEHLQKAAEGTKVLKLVPSAGLDDWLNKNCPHLSYDQAISQCDFGMLQNETYDLIIGSPIEEKRHDAFEVLAEMKRILKPDGKIVFFGRVTLENDLVYSLGKEYFGKEVFEQCGLTDSDALCVLTKQKEVSLNFEENVIIDEKLCREGPLVSVIMSCYNHGKFVAEAIESVIHQSYRNIEFLVADDGSKDDSADVMKQYSSYFTKEFYYNENKGSRFQILKEEAQGKYIALINSDDVWEPDKLAMQVKYLEEHEECGVCFTWCACTDENLKNLDTSFFIQKNRNPYEWMELFWDKGNVLCNPSTVMRRELSLRTPKYGSGCWQLPDYFKWIDLIQTTNFYVLPRMMTKLRKHEKEANANASAITTENILRHYQEEGCNWIWVIRDMETVFFKSAFRKYMIDKQAETEQDIKCEKFFLLLGHRNTFVQNSALIYLAEIYHDVKENLENKYHYTIKNLKEDMVQQGIAPKFLTKEKV